MIRELVPRVFSDVLDWVGNGLGNTHPIRMENFRESNRYVVRAELPGVDPEHDVKVRVDRGILTLEAARNEERHDEHRTEFRYGALRRSVTLPATAEEDGISAHYDRGILEISVPLHEHTREGRAIPVGHH
jgi:HSP20 family molecular chaperone IbpA